jgi:uncharacterized protein (DUF983 family)
MMPIEQHARHAHDVGPRRSIWRTLRRGLGRQCPACGQGNVFRGYLKVQPNCASCGLDLARFRADDAPPYFTILIVLHIIGPAMLWTEQWAQPPEWVQFAIWLPAALALTLYLLPRVKSTVIGVQWATKSAG